MTTSGFRQVDETEIWSGYVWRLVHATFEDPAGNRFTREFVRSPGAVSAVPIVYDDADVSRTTPLVVLIKQYRASLDDLVIEVPAGTRDVAGEDDAGNVRRELVEEVGLKAGNVEFLSSYYSSPGMTDSNCAIFLATDCTPVERSPHGPEEEHAEVFQIPLVEAIAWVESGTITDAKSVIGLLLAERRLRTSASE